MAPRKRSRDGAGEEHTHLGVTVERHDADIGTGINIDMRLGPPTYPRMNEPVIMSDKMVKVSGVVHYPEERAGERFVVRLVAGSRHEEEMQQRLKDIQARDEHGSLRYRRYRGYDYPVFDASTGMGLMHRMRDPAGWDIWLPVPSGIVSDMLVLLGQDRPLYLAIHELKRGRDRRVLEISLKTTDPALE